MATFHFDLVSPERLLLSGEVEQVDVPGSEGDFGVLAGHAPMVTSLRPGILTIKRDGGEMKIVVLGGFAEISPSGLTVLADSATALEEFDRELLAEHIKAAEDKVAKMRQETSDAVDKEIARLDHFKALDYHLQGTAMH
ncbi:F0F1 ATP synthase subunit epsilon [Pseudorhodoplanes sp.]|jgi:F-type H+-transporting ATPase subunit epsilon|uniref:F0F1 ATP synthase subunit epsilon n=1 Tax=Pseudorhodoplanes sp. TaxID=1934341 RepID=UPI002BCDA716|nr:F0F1 ATP synthase subunit epsilon [Pseudorhodoplanes sp.]HWV40230.1 F0F1 ATP synthase subunit epsilon [Pseudorhodoplanes sp.]